MQEAMGREAANRLQAAMQQFLEATQDTPYPAAQALRRLVQAFASSADQATSAGAKISPEPGISGMKYTLDEYEGIARDLAEAFGLRAAQKAAMHLDKSDLNDLVAMWAHTEGDVSPKGRMCKAVVTSGATGIDLARALGVAKDSVRRGLCTDANLVPALYEKAEMAFQNPAAHPNTNPVEG